jgi:plastocyanin
MRTPRAAELAAGTLVAVLLSVGAAGCEHVKHVGRNRTLRVALTEYRLNPQSVRVAAGTLTIAVKNSGRMTHNLVVSRGGRSIASTRALAPGQSTRLKVLVTRGTYVMTSTVLSDQALGEYGTLSVTR